MRTPRHARIALAATAGVLACVSLQWEPMGPRRTAPIEGAEIVGTEECGVCHEDVQGHEKIAGYHAVCESCHGGGSLHAETEAVADIRHPSNADCLSCHRPGRNTHLEWGSGEHSRAGLLCSDCHNPHDVSKRPNSQSIPKNSNRSGNWSLISDSRDTIKLEVPTASCLRHYKIEWSNLP